MRKLDWKILQVFVKVYRYSNGAFGLNLTKTPYLVLFILLGAVGIGTASAVGMITFSSPLDMSNNQINNVAEPTASSDATTKAYVDSHIDADDDLDATNEIQTLTINQRTTVSPTGNGVSLVTATANCLSGEILTGGGMRVSDPNAPTSTVFNGPLGNSWQVQVKPIIVATSFSVTSYALCAKLSP